MAWIQLREGATCSEEDIKQHCQGKIAHYKVPRYVRFTDAFPMTVTGKVQKFKMRQTAIEELGLAEIATA
jgi:fatty-acyl-CoA synthase